MPSTGTRSQKIFRICVDVACGLCIVLASLIPDTIAPGKFRVPEDFDLLAGMAAVLMALMLLVRRRWPVQVFALVLAISIVVTATGHSSLGCVLAVGIAVFEIARTGQRLIAYPCAALSIVSLGTILVVRSHETIPRVIGVLAIIGFAAAAGDALHSRRALIDSMTERALRAEETREEEARRRVIQERLRIARELHDAAAHQIAVINLQSGAAKAALTGNRREDTERALGNIQLSARNVLSEIAALLVVLRSEEEAEPPNLPPVRGLDDLAPLIQGFEAAGLRISGNHNPELPASLPGAVDVVAYKVIQEALTNAHKHGTNGSAELGLVIERQQLKISVPNQIAFQAQQDQARSGYGLTGIRERVASVHGEMQAVTKADSFILKVSLPLEPEQTP